MLDTAETKQNWPDKSPEPTGDAGGSALRRWAKERDAYRFSQ
jgi:hypothetical protein